MDGVFEHCLAGRTFHAHTGPTDSALLIRPTDAIEAKFADLPAERQKLIRCVVGTHVALDVARIFNRNARFFTIVRDPVDRVISSFFHNRSSLTLRAIPTSRI